MEPVTQKSYPVTLTLTRPERSSRWLALATLLFAIPKVIMLIPHFIALYFLGIFSFFVGVVAQFVVLFTGRFPEGLFKIVRGILQWQVRLNCYFFGLTDTYPPFSFD
jgi:hypothetical protein